MKKSYREWALRLDWKPIEIEQYCLANAKFCYQEPNLRASFAEAGRIVDAKIICQFNGRADLVAVFYVLDRSPK